MKSSYQSSSNASSPKLKLVKQKPDVRLGGTLPTADMGPGKYLVDCDNAWLEPVSKNTKEHRAVIQFRVIDGKFNGVALRMWIDKAADAGGSSRRMESMRGIAKSPLAARSKKATNRRGKFSQATGF